MLYVYGKMGSVTLLLAIASISSDDKALRREWRERGYSGVFSANFRLNHIPSIEEYRQK